MSLKQTDFNYPEIVADQENFEEELLLSSLKNCDPYIFLHTIEWHRQEILKQLQGMEKSAKEKALAKLNKELEKFINLRIELDSERVRKNKDATRTILAKLQNQAIKINELIGYSLITDPLMISNFRQQLDQLLRNVSKAGFENNIASRLKDEINKLAEKEISEQSFKYSNARLARLTKKIKDVNDALTEEDKHLSFISALEKVLNINIT